MNNTSSPLPSTALAEGVPLGRLPGLVGYALRRAQAAVFHDLHAALEPEDIRATQFAVLEVLHAGPGFRANQVSAALGIRTTNFVPLFDALEVRGLVERRAMAGDRRAKGLFLTEAGAALLGRLGALVAAHEARFAARVGVEGKAQLLGLLARLGNTAFD